MVDVRTADVVSEADGKELWPVYDAVFADQPDHETWRDQVWTRHSGRAGFQLARAYGPGGLVGFAYGYTGEPGQWWTDNARAALGPELADEWLGGHFEVVSIGVLAASRGAGTGRALLRALLGGLPHDRLLLMTASEPTDPAHRLYTSAGWQVIGPGIGDATVIMGRRTNDGSTSRQ
jgi:ribosomal protein S18 acetylase RimI-like enzyme